MSTNGPQARSNAEIAQRLREIRALMEFAGEDYFRFMAYERAADAVHNAPPLADLIASGELTSLPGVGKSIAEKIAAIVASGTCDYLDELRGRYPPGLMEVLTVPGIGIKTARMLYEQFEIGSLDDLERALESARSPARRGLERNRWRTCGAESWRRRAASAAGRSAWRARWLTS